MPLTINRQKGLIKASEDEITMLKKQNKHNGLIIGGDFNAPGIDWPTLTIKGHQYPEHMNKHILDITKDNVFEQIVDFPTQEDKTLDLILTMHPSTTARCKPLPSLGRSNHDIVLYDTSLMPFRPRLPQVVPVGKSRFGRHQTGSL